MREREREGEKNVEEALKSKGGTLRKPSKNCHEKALPQGSFLPFSSLYSRFMLAQKVGIAFLPENTTSLF